MNVGPKFIVAVADFIGCALLALKRMRCSSSFGVQENIRKQLLLFSLGNSLNKNDMLLDKSR